MKTSLVAELVTPATYLGFRRHLWLLLVFWDQLPRERGGGALVSLVTYDNHLVELFGWLLETEGAIQVWKEKKVFFDEVKVLDFTNYKNLQWLQLLAAVRCH